ncbi:hypothetical protein N0V93_003157 [Gnomoniopsis smithogilvyi]|uniref:Uncharacterized protein n=1 Tax=Gnomoniopsis smithogilvyi TaxID=1191159 RepID=A0A9W9CYC3_9PEZI|nr:hypothetical protein N0V93_003157 [Gnomoniopsis smithogilvyi]
MPVSPEELHILVEEVFDHQSSIGDQLPSESTQSSVDACRQPGHQQKLISCATASSDQQPPQTTPDSLRQPPGMNSGPRIMSPSAPGGIDLVMSEQSSLESSCAEDSSTQSSRCHVPQKWLSTEAYLDSIASVQPKFADSSLRRTTLTFPLKSAKNRMLKDDDRGFSPVLSDIEDSHSCSELESEAGKNSHKSRAVVDITVSIGTPEEVSTSHVDELRAIRDQLMILMDKQQYVMSRHSGYLLEIATALCRDEVLKEVSKALRERASMKFTMGKSERLILEREADMVFRMTSMDAVTPIREEINALQAVREQTRQAIMREIDMLFEKACALASTT